MNKITPQYLQNLQRQLAKVQHMATDYNGTHQTNPELMDAIDNMTRVANFLVQEFQQHLEKGNSDTYDPQDYIDGKLELATLHLTRYTHKVKLT